MIVKLNFMKARWAIGAAGFLVGAILILGIRVAAYQPPATVHYHANFAVYINGQKEQFNAMNYYEEEAAASCSVSAASETETSPMSRVHMHGNVNDVVHIEDSRVSWGNFFTVLGWNVGSNYIASRDTLYQTNGQDKVTYILNGKTVGSITNTIIGDQDKLLVNFGSQTTDEINQEFNGIQNNALRADQSKDPASCGSHENTTTMSQRMKRMFQHQAGLEPK